MGIGIAILMIALVEACETPEAKFVFAWPHLTCIWFYRLGNIYHLPINYDYQLNNLTASKDNIQARTTQAMLLWMGPRVDLLS